jgi:hypothetical protein
MALNRGFLSSGDNAEAGQAQGRALPNRFDPNPFVREQAATEWLPM